MTLRGGRYELLGTIASGGMATVHLGRAVGAGGFERLVAIKTMHPHLSSEPEFVSMFLDEARLAARIRHPNVVGTIDIQQDEQGLFLVMEYVEGPSVSQLTRALGKQKKLLPLDITLRIMLDTLAGLHAAHELCGSDGEPLNVIHRDVSPHNVLVGIDGIARIMDFGVARAEARISSSTRAGDVKGKISYMAPEQVAQKEMDRRVDIYAAAVTLWELLTGRRLVRAENDLVAMNIILNSEHAPPHEIVASIPPALSEVVMRAMARSRDDRFPTAAAFADALERVVQTENIAVATPRAVGAFVRALEIHKAPSDLQSSSRSLHASAAPVATAGTASGISASTSASAVQPITTGSEPSTSTESRGGFASTPPAERKPNTSNRKVIIAAASAVVILGVGAWFVLSTKSRANEPQQPTSVAAPEPRASSSAAEPKPAQAPPATSTIAVAPTANPTAPSAPTSAPAARTPNTAPVGPKSPKTFVPKEL